MCITVYSRRTSITANRPLYMSSSFPNGYTIGYYTDTLIGLYALLLRLARSPPLRFPVLHTVFHLLVRP